MIFIGLSYDYPIYFCFETNNMKLFFLEQARLVGGILETLVKVTPVVGLAFEYLMPETILF